MLTILGEVLEGGKKGSKVFRGGRGRGGWEGGGRGRRRCFGGGGGGYGDGRLRLDCLGRERANEHLNVLIITVCRW